MKRGSPLFDHLVGAREQRRRHLEAERLHGFEIDHQLVFGGSRACRSGRNLLEQLQPFSGQAILGDKKPVILPLQV